MLAVWKCLSTRGVVGQAECSCHLVMRVMRRNPFDWLCTLWLLLSWIKLLELRNGELQNFRRTLEWIIEAIT